MQDLRSNNDGFRGTLCGRRYGNDEDNDNSGISSNASWQQAPLGVLAGVCGQSFWPNGTFNTSGVHPLEYYLNMTQNVNDKDDEDDDRSADQKLACSEIVGLYSKYNVTGRQG